jgi:hypothetical protein
MALLPNRIALRDWYATNVVGDQMFWRQAADNQQYSFLSLASAVGVYESGAWVIATHRSKSIDLPVVMLERPDIGVQFVLRNNFYNWKLSVVSERPIIDDKLMYLFYTEPPREPEYTGPFEGFPPDLIFGYYGQSDGRRWSAELNYTEEVWSVLFLCTAALGGCQARRMHTEVEHRAVCGCDPRNAIHARAG